MISPGCGLPSQTCWFVCLGETRELGDNRYPATDEDDAGETDLSAGDEYRAVEIEDDPNNSTLPSCDTGTLESPGSDIDAAQLDSGVYLANCVLTGTVGCDSTASSVTDAEGAPDGSGHEAEGEYLSLNGGTLRCAWSDGLIVTPTSGQTITVYEFGGSSGTNVEQYRVRLSRIVGAEIE